MCNSFIASGSGIEYGTAYNHKDITLGVSDCFAVRGIYEGIGGSTPLPPSAVLGSPSRNICKRRNHYWTNKGVKNY